MSRGRGSIGSRGESNGKVFPYVGMSYVLESGIMFLQSIKWLRPGEGEIRHLIAFIMAVVPAVFLVRVYRNPKGKIRLAIDDDVRSGRAG